jgi:hypothetical protein
MKAAHAVAGRQGHVQLMQQRGMRGGDHPTMEGRLPAGSLGYNPLKGKDGDVCAPGAAGIIGRNAALQQAERFKATCDHQTITSGNMRE